MATEEPRRSIGTEAATERATCVECGRVSDPYWGGWLAYRVDDPETDTEPELGFFCPDCALREFGRPARG